MSKGIRIENGVVIGTSSDKYTSANPIARRLVAGFDRAISELAAIAAPASIVEVGCGEGHIVGLLLQATTASIHATDLSSALVEEARDNIQSDRVTFATGDVMTMRPSDPAPDLIVCCEVLEHLPDPMGGLRALRAHNARHYLFSVPREPIWRALNMARGAYVGDFGNSPGHLQHWSRRGFLNFVTSMFEPIEVRSPLPWTAVLCRPRTM